jgi:hypothetical protein
LIGIFTRRRHFDKVATKTGDVSFEACAGFGNATVGKCSDWGGQGRLGRRARMGSQALGIRKVLRALLGKRRFSKCLGALITRTDRFAARKPSPRSWLRSDGTA